MTSVTGKAMLRDAEGRTGTRRVIFTVDYEGIHGMPDPTSTYDLEATTLRLLETLDRRKIKGVFFVVARLVNEHPALIEQLAGAGHEVGLHGVDHENLAAIDEARLSHFGKQLDEASEKLAQICGQRPRGFRAPYLMAPKFYSPQVYALLVDQGFTWVSNRAIRYPEELLRPDKCRTSSLWRIAARKGLPASRLATIALNPGLVFWETKRGHIGHPAAWLFQGAAPFRRGALMELPELSPLDCDLIGLPNPDLDSDPELLAYARWALTERFDRSNKWFSLTIHDWISGTANRLANLGTLLDELQSRSALDWVRPGLDDPDFGALVVES
jgi:peptidoglycan/xylan/chitin deacetylase (PgdA/CDA1 family)